MTITTDKLQAIIAKFKQKQGAAQDATTREAIRRVEHLVDTHKPTHIDFTAAGVPTEAAKTPAGEDAIVSIIRESSGQLSVKVDNTSASEVHTPENAPVYATARAITLNDKQRQFQDLVLSGQSCVLIGAAGTGKTTCMRSVTRALIDSEMLPKLGNSTKHLLSGHPGAVILSFTNKAVNNIRHAVVDELKPHTLTIHKLLEFAPEFFEEIDPEDPTKMRKTMRFLPMRTSKNPLPRDLMLVAFEESSMIGVDLYNLLQDALPWQHHQEIFLGDIQQLPPVFGLAVLGFKMLELPLVELTEIYRQAQNSPIISLAHALLEGDPFRFMARSQLVDYIDPRTGKTASKKEIPSLKAFEKETTDGTVKFTVWQKPMDPEIACHAFNLQIRAWIDNGYFDPEVDIILCPYNKAFGTVEINAAVAWHLGRQRDAVVYEVIAGFNKHYLAVGDRVLFDKEDATIINIAPNGKHVGSMPQLPSRFLDRWGTVRDDLGKDTAAELFMHKQQAEAAADDGIDFMLTGNIDDVTDRVNSASHVITLKMKYSEEEISIDSAAEVNALIGGYAITVHKAQGSEYGKVILALHRSHAKMISRELLYTAITRARNTLHIVCEPNTFERGIQSQRIVGNTIEEKAESFKGKKSVQEKDHQPLLSHTVERKAELFKVLKETAVEEEEKKELTTPQIKLPSSSSPPTIIPSTNSLAKSLKFFDKRP